MKINCRLKSFVKKKEWSAKHICEEFSYKNCAVSSVGDLLRKIDTTNSISLRPVADGWANATEYLACSWTDTQSGRQPWVQQKSQRYWKVDRNISQLCAMTRGFGRSYLDQQLISKAVDQWLPRIKCSSSSSRRAHWTVVYLTVWLLYTAVTWI